MCCLESLEDETERLVAKPSRSRNKLLEGAPKTDREKLVENYNNALAEFDSQMRLIEDKIAYTNKALEEVRASMTRVMGKRKSEELPKRDLIALNCLFTEEKEHEHSLAEYSANKSSLLQLRMTMERQYVNAMTSPSMSRDGRDRNATLDVLQEAERLAPEREKTMKLFMKTLSHAKERQAEEAEEIEEERSNGGEATRRIMEIYTLTQEQMDRLDSLVVPTTEPVLRTSTLPPSLPMEPIAEHPRPVKPKRMLYAM